ncbi:MAG: sugar phosphate isomerase/epimerase [Armatimonadetes bacterium]|nr:sugar phosphate isomerase/epimerase [Armatimonadota bacterium]
MKPIALQTYTLRDAFEKDFLGTLRAVAEIGYKGIEVGGMYGQETAEYVKAVSDLGLVVTSNHGALPTPETLAEIVDLQQALGSTRLVSGYGPDDLKTVDGCKACAEKLQKAADLLKPHGISVHVHNHYWEFHRVEDGRYPFEILMEQASYIFSQLDLYWVAFGGADPVEVLARYGKRVELAHVKDGALGAEYHFAALGAGQVNLPAAISALDPAVTQWLIVEQDLSDGDMMQDVKTSYAYLTANGLGEGKR